MEAGLHHCGAIFPVAGGIQESVVEFAHSDLSELSHKEENGHFPGL